MKVSDIESVLDRLPMEYERVTADQITVEGRRVRTPSREFDCTMEEDGTLALSRWLGISSNFMKSLPDDLFQANLSWFLEKREEQPLLLECERSALLGIYPGDQGMISQSEFAEVIDTVMEPDDVVDHLYLGGGGVLSARIVTDRITVQPRVGDVTAGGLRLDAHISPRVKAPRVGAFMQRLQCLNGMTVEEPYGIVSVKGSTVDDVIAEMQLAAVRVLSGVQDRLAQWEATVSQRVPDPDRMVHRLATEHGLPASVERRILDRMPTIEGDTMYDVLNLITSEAHAEGVKAATIERLHLLAGSVIASQESRCPSCAHRLG